MSDTPIAQHVQCRELLLSLKEVLSLVESGTLVRNTGRDFNPGWMTEAAKVVMALKRAQDATDAADFLLNVPEGPSESETQK